MEPIQFRWWSLNESHHRRPNPALGSHVKYKLLNFMLCNACPFWILIFLPHRRRWSGLKHKKQIHIYANFSIKPNGLMKNPIQARCGKGSRIRNWVDYSRSKLAFFLLVSLRATAALKLRRKKPQHQTLSNFISSSLRLESSCSTLSFLSSSQLCQVQYAL